MLIEAVGDGHDEAWLVRRSTREVRDKRTEACRLEGENNVAFTDGFQRA